MNKDIDVRVFAENSGAQPIGIELVGDNVADIDADMLLMASKVIRKHPNLTLDAINIHHDEFVVTYQLFATPC